MKIVSKLFGCLAILLFLSSCHSMYYWRDKAVQRARKYALEETRELSQLQRNYIRYAPPHLLDSTIFTREGKEFKAKRDLTQTCIVWNVPGLKKSLVVFGYSERRLNDWHPNRILWKNYKQKSKAKEDALKLARKYVLQHMTYLTTEQFNDIRFAYPKIVLSKYGVKKRRKLGKNYHEISMSWPSGEEGKEIVVTGYGLVDMRNWKPLIGQIRLEEEVKHYSKPGSLIPY